MNSFPSFWTAPLGLLAGLMYASFMVHWLALLLSAIGKLSDKPKGKRSAMGLTLAIVHPAPWGLLVGVAFIANQIHGGKLNAEWLWFSGSLLAGIGLMVVVPVLMIRKVRKRAESERDKPAA